jgi:hypothetical protein
MKFCDSSFAIGQSQKDKNLRYIKQIKVRQNEFIYDMDSVCLCQIVKPNNYLHFELICCVNELEHLKVFELEEKEKRKIEAIKMHEGGISNVDIAKKFRVTEGAVRKWIKLSEGTE